MKKTRNLLVLVLVLGLLPSCKSMLNILTPKAPPEMVAMIMDKASKIRFSPAKKLGKSKTARIPLKAGQWVTTLTVNKDASGNVMLSTTRVISVTGSTVVIETENYSALDKGERQLARITFENYPTGGSLSYSQAEYDATINTIRIVKLVTKTGDQPPQEVPEQFLMMSQGMTKSVAGAAVRTSEMTQDSCSTSSIQASLCYCFDYTVSVMGITRSGKSAVHSEIPVNGMIRMDSEDMVMETIAFGTSGAVSQF